MCRQPLCPSRPADPCGSACTPPVLTRLASPPTPKRCQGEAMPLLYVDVIEGRTEEDVRTLLDALHEAVVEAFGVPPRDRYQIVRTHPSHEVVVWDTGLGINRSAA